MRAPRVGLHVVPPPAGAEREPTQVLDPTRGLVVLIVEDDFAYAELLEGQLEDALRGPVDVSHAPTLGSARQALAQGGIDCVLLDLSLPDEQGLATVESVAASAPDVAIVVLTGFDDDRTALRTVQAGAQDYLVKARADGPSIVRSIRYAMERKHSELALLRQATHDPLTGLVNRVLFMDRLELALGRARREHSGLAVLFVDLDDFKTINDSLGHEVGDAVLLEVADRFTKTLRPTDTVARFGGDEFLLLCPDLLSPADVEPLLGRLRRALSDRFEVAGRRVGLNASVGVAFDLGGTASPGDLVRNADMAMYAAKLQAGGFTTSAFEGEMGRGAEHALDIVSELRDAAAGLLLHYQPQVDLATGRLVGVEGLLRWDHPARGRLAPDQFILHAERTGDIVALGEWALHEACRQARDWASRGAMITVSVNVSPVQLLHPGFVEAVDGALRANALDPSRLTLEITESGTLATADTAEAVHRLATLGVSVALDDFGTGYAALAALADLPISAIKIDPTFLHALEHGRRARLLEGVLGLARTLGVGVVAEGIETLHQLELLRGLGCEHGQGYLFSPACAAGDITALLTSGATLQTAD